MTAVNAPSRTSTSVGAVPAALAVTGALLAGNGLVLGSQMFFDSRDYSEVVQGAAHLAHYAIWTGCLIALCQLYPLLRGLPRAVLVLAGVGAALDACSRFVLAFVMPFMAKNDPALVDEAPDALLLTVLLSTGVVAMVGTIALAVAAWRRRLAPRPALVLMILGAVAIPALGPLSNVLLGLGLLWFGMALRTRSAA